MEQVVCDKACKILHDTRDGEDLSPKHLWLVQEMVNGRLNEKGKQAFEQLYQSVLAGYKKPWFHDIENLTIDHVGYVYWKGSVVEHYDSPWEWSTEAKKAAEEVAIRCRHLESIKVELSIRNVIFDWFKYDPLKIR